jgi:hypothetical protein
MGNLATFAHLVIAELHYFDISLIRYTVLLFIYLVFIIFGEKLSVQ